MTKSRIEAFSDGVIAIIITIMVLELKVPHGAEWADLAGVGTVFLCYIFSFVNLAIYWGNHHHLMHTVHQVNSKIIWSNLHLLFWLSIVPFTTAWMGENHFAELPLAAYSVNLLLCAISYYFLQQTIMADHTHSTKLIIALKKQEKKGTASLIIYILCVVFAFIVPLVSEILIVAVGVMWVIPDKNIERALKD